MTNNHVVDHAKTVTVTTDDGKIHTATVVGTDPRSDLALIKVDGGDAELPRANARIAEALNATPVQDRW